MLYIEHVLDSAQTDGIFDFKFRQPNSWTWYNHDYSAVQWKSLGNIFSAPRRDPIAWVLDGTLFDVSIVAKIAHGVLPSQSSIGGRRISEFRDFPMDTWSPSVKDDFRYPSNLLNSYAMPFVGSYSSKIYRRDHNVWHYSLSGNLALRRDDIRRIQRHTVGTRTIHGLTIPSYSRFIYFGSDTIDEWPDESAAAPPGFLVAGAPLNVYVEIDPSFGKLISFENFTTALGPSVETLKVLSSLGTIERVYPTEFGEFTTIRITGLRWHLYEDRFDVSYRLDESSLHLSSLNRINATWEINTGIRFVPGVLNPSFYSNRGWYSPKGIRPHTYHSYKLIAGETVYWDGSVFTHDPYSNSFEEPNLTVNDAHLYQGPYFSSDASRSHPSASVSPETFAVRASVSFGSFWDARISELRRSAIYAFQDGLEDHLRFLKNNYLEVLKELPDLPSLVPNLGLLAKIVSKINLRNVITGVVKLGDWITSENLRYNFGISPDLGVISELNRVGPTIASRLIVASRTTKRTLRGRFEFELPESPESFNTCTLVTSCKCTVVFPQDPTWFAIASLYGAGLAPSLQNIWENIPFSFALDWATNMSVRLKSIDLSLLAIFLAVEDIQFSYKITGDLDINDYIESNNLLLPINESSSSITGSFYRRELVTSLPVLTDGHYDFLSGNPSPSLGILGSLIFQLVH